MKLIIGLGNPSQKFQKTRHNIGFRVVDELRSSSRFAYAHVIDELGFLKNKKVILAKPKTFMNRSGKAVKKWMNFYKIKPENLWIIHDDIDLPLGKIRISKSRGAAGHKGVQSIIEELGTKNFIRFRIGIKPTMSTFSTIVENVDKFVLQKFNKGEEKIVKEVIKKTVEAIEFALKEDVEKAMNKFNE